MDMTKRMIRINVIEKRTVQRWIGNPFPASHIPWNCVPAIQIIFILIPLHIRFDQGAIGIRKVFYALSSKRSRIEKLTKSLHCVTERKFVLFHLHNNFLCPVW